MFLSVVGPTVPALAARLHAQESDLSVVFAANFLAAAGATAIAGPFFDRAGTRVLFPAGLLVAALGALGEGLASSLPLLAAAALVAGLGIGVINVGGNAAGSLLYPERREAVLNALNALFGAGAFLAPLFVDLSAARFGGYAPVYIVAAFLLAAPAPLLLAGLPRGGGGHMATGSLRSLLALPGLWAPIVMGFLYLGSEIGFAGWIVVVLQRMTGLSAAGAAPAGALFWLFLALGGLPTGLLLRHGYAPWRILGAGAILAACAAAALALFGAAIPLAVACCALVGLGFAPIFPLAIAAAVRITSERTPSAVGVATSFVLVAAQIGAATLPAIQGLLLRAGPGAVVGLTCACSLLILAVQLISVRLTVAVNG